MTALITLLAPGHVGAGVVWNEAVNGDLSNDRLNPTPLALSVGTNSLMATSVFGDREYLTFTLGAGQQLVAIDFVSYEGLDQVAFMGVQAGTTLTEPPTMTNVANLLGWTHFGTDVGVPHPGSDVLDDLAAGPGAIGFTPPLNAGPYTFWIQQTGGNAATYQFDFIVTPAPGAAAVMMMFGLIGRRRRR